jgi:2-polyprenyl-6-methoxyphenol hydroxylase-like FAD-dependent oxidoreductase
MGEDQDVAVVLGASVAGLLAAQALAERYATVIMVERDELPSRPLQRRGVPQARQIHALLTGGQRALERLLPGITAELAGAGAPVGDALADMELCFGGHWFRRAPSGLTMVCTSRSLLEHRVRSRVLDLPNVSLLDGCDVVGLAGLGARVAGVRVLRRLDDSVEELLGADLVVDATGRGSRLPRWLAALGLGAPPEEKISVGLGYTTRRLRLPIDALGGAYGVLRAPTADRPRGLALSRIEGQLWMLTLVGLHGAAPPSAAEDFHRFAASVDARVAALIRDADPVEDAASFRFPASVRRHYEQLRLPANLVVLGDSMCSFNPVYGQGMTVAALEALVLRRHVLGGPFRGRRVMAELAGIVDVPWRLTTMADRPFVTPVPPSTAAERWMAGYVDRLQRSAAGDGSAGADFLSVTSLVEPPRALFRPRTVWRALRPPPGRCVLPVPEPAGLRPGSHAAGGPPCPRT